MRRIASIVSWCIFAACLWAQAAPEKPELFTRTEVMVPMRDGVHLQTAIFVPKTATQPLPILLTRTPYGVPENERGLTAGSYDELIADGYIFVLQNLRGRFKSEGQWVMQRPPCATPTGCTDESTDAYDTVDWLIKNVANNNGRVGMFGISYPGWTTAMAMLGPHPALKAVSEQASPADMFLGDDFHHNGAFRLSYGFEYAAMMETAKDANTDFKFDKHDTYEWYLALGALANADAKYFHGTIPTWVDFVNHPNRDAFWQRQALDSFLKHTTVPNLNVAGWYDQEDFWGPVKIYSLLEPSDSQHLNYLVAGPWNHGGWMRGAGDRLGPIPFDSATAKYFRANVQAPWFAYWLHDKGQLTEPEALTFETGSNQWRRWDSWPPKQATARKLYFRAGRRLSFEPPTDAAASDSYVSDPANPVPYRPRPVTATYAGPEWPVWLVQDQRFVDHRPDVLTWETEPLKEDVVIAGDIVADLFASTTGSDSDWIVKLIDVYPDDWKPAETAPAAQGQPGPRQPNLAGYELIVADEVFRGRFRASFEKPAPIPPNVVQEYKFSLHTNDHAFLKGHKIMVQVQSTWFPLIDRNPQKFVPNIFKASDADYVKATQRIFRSKTAASSIILPVVAAP
jgi:hypothetical protein